MNQKLHSLELVGDVKLQAVCANRAFSAVCNLMVRSGKHGFVLVVADTRGNVVVRKRYVEEQDMTALRRELDSWNCVHGDTAKGDVLSARMVEVGNTHWMQMPYLHTLWDRSPEADAVLAAACGCRLDQVWDVAMELAEEELRRVASRGVYNLDARLMNMGFCKEGGKVRGAMIDFADVHRYSEAVDGEFGAWEAQVAAAMIAFLRRDVPLHPVRQRFLETPRL